jgi:sugar phosphate isomerase/epimerase
MDHLRRNFLKATLAGLPVYFALRRADAAVNKSLVAGVQLGCQTYSFHEVTRGGPEAIDSIIMNMKNIGLGMCELFSPDLEPFAFPWSAVEPWAPGASKGSGPAGNVNAAVARNNANQSNPEGKKRREELRNWRLSVPLDYFSGVATKFLDSGIRIYCYNLSFNESFSDQEIDRGFEIAKALGTNIITASSTVSVSKRLVPFAEKHRTYVAFHGHSDVNDLNQFSSPTTFAEALKLSSYFKVNLDIGHFWSAGFDPVVYIQQEHSHITNLHLKDRLNHEGPNVPWNDGPGHTPIRQVLELLKKERWDIPAFIEYEYQGPESPPAEVAKCYAYAKKILQG